MKKLIAVTAMLTCGLLQFSIPINASEPPDMHECGVTPYPIFPNSPHVQLLFTENGLDCPKELHYFFIDKAGMGYFKYLNSIRKVDLASDWSCARKHRDTYSFWGIFHGERVEKARGQYFVDLKFKRKIVEAYRIRGPHVLAPNWRKLETGEKKSNSPPPGANSGFSQ